MQGWRIPYKTMADGRTPAAAVATVFADVVDIAVGLPRGGTFYRRLPV
jgi:hypothetical protein